MSKKEAGKEGLVTNELRAIYQQAADEGFWIKELIGQPGHYMTTAIPIKKLKKMLKYAKKEKLMIGGKRIKTLHDVYNSLKLGDVINFDLGSPGSGKTREEASKDALLKSRKGLN